MSRRSPRTSPAARREATRQRLIGEGELPDRAGALVTTLEAHSADGLERDGRRWAAAGGGSWPALTGGLAACVRTDPDYLKSFLQISR